MTPRCWIWQKWSLRLREGRDVGSRTQTIWEPETKGPARCLVMSRTQEPLGTGDHIQPSVLETRAGMQPRMGFAWGTFRKRSLPAPVLHPLWLEFSHPLSRSRPADQQPGPLSLLRSPAFMDRERNLDQTQRCL